MAPTRQCSLCDEEITDIQIQLDDAFLVNGNNWCHRECYLEFYGDELEHLV